MRKQTRKFYILFTISIAIMILIFCFSSQNAEESSKVSGSVLQWILDTLSNILPQTIIVFLQNYIRKVAHFTIYMLLGIFVYWTSNEYRTTKSLYQLEAEDRTDTESKANADNNVSASKGAGQSYPRTRRFLFSWMITIVYAMTDEFHQLFVPGRAGQVRDVCIDSTGALCGIFIIASFLIIYRNKMAKEVK